MGEFCSRKGWTRFYLTEVFISFEMLSVLEGGRWWVNGWKDGRKEGRKEIVWDFILIEYFRKFLYVY